MWRLLVYTELVYTIVVLDGLKGFDWDLHNVGHAPEIGIGSAIHCAHASLAELREDTVVRDGLRGTHGAGLEEW
jgi:hypothetical protein